MKRSLPVFVTFIACMVCVTALAADKKTVSIKDMQFDPQTVQINVGDTVVWTNKDIRDHTVVAVDGSFESDNLGSGESFRFTFQKAGKFAYRCTLHPRMKGTIVVTGQSRVAQAQAVATFKR